MQEGYVKLGELETLNTWNEKKIWTYDFLKWPCHHTRWTYTSANGTYTEHEHVLWTA